MSTDESTRAEFERLLTPQHAVLLGYALKLTRARADAEDLLQESVYRALRGFRTFRRGSNFKAWMFRIITNTFISARRKEQRGPRTVEVDSVASLAASPEAGRPVTGSVLAYDDVVEDEVKHALDSLPECFRRPLLLSALGGLSYKEIARVLQVPLGTVMSRLHRARRRLQEPLEAYGQTRGLTPARSLLPTARPLDPVLLQPVFGAALSA